MGQILEYCSRCGTSGPPEYFKEIEGLILCPQCQKEHDYSDNFDLFCELATIFDPHGPSI